MQAMDINYSQLTFSDLEKFGCSFPLLSKYSMKVSVDDKVVGFVAIEDKSINIKIAETDTEDVVEYKKNINNRETFYLRKIMFLPQYEELLLLPLFTRVNKQMPFNYQIWCRPSVWDKYHYCDKIGGFQTPIYNIGKEILLFSLNV